MRRTILFILIFTVFIACKKQEAEETKEKTETQITAEEETPEVPKIQMSLEHANQLATTLLNCLSQEYPNKMHQTITQKEQIAEPKELHPSFYGCADWSSAIQAHWALVSLLSDFPDLKNREEIMSKLEESLSAENIQAELNYFQQNNQEIYSKTYGWSWFLKLSEQLQDGETSFASKLHKNTQPLADFIVEQYRAFLPQQDSPVRAGNYENTALALSLLYDYADSTQQEELKKLVRNRATNYFLKDKNCPFAYELSAHEFLSACFQEIDIMRKVLPEKAFDMWMKDFFPELQNANLDIKIAESTTDEDEDSIFLNGVNFSRAWVMYGLAEQYPKKYSHLRELANVHLDAALPSVLNRSYSENYWLGSFAVYALNQEDF